MDDKHYDELLYKQSILGCKEEGTHNCKMFWV